MKDSVEGMLNYQVKPLYIKDTDSMTLVLAVYKGVTHVAILEHHPTGHIVLETVNGICLSTSTLKTIIKIMEDFDNVMIANETSYNYPTKYFVDICDCLQWYEHPFPLL